MMLHYSNLMGFFSETMEAQLASMRCLDEIPRLSPASCSIEAYVLTCPFT